MIVLIGGEKGGTGKSTISTNLSVMRVLEKRDILLFDLDPQRTATYWASRRDENSIEPRVASSQKILDDRILNPGIVIRNEIKELKHKYEDIIIDAGGAASEVLRAAMTLADVLVLPVMPSSFDVWTLSKMNALISEVSHTNPTLRVVLVYNKVAPNPHTAKSEINDSNEVISDFEYVCVRGEILTYRVAVRRAQNRGLAVVELKPQDDKAIEEIEKIYNKVFYGKEK